MRPKTKRNFKTAGKVAAGTAIIAATVAGGMKASEMRRLNTQQKNRVYVQAIAKSKVPVRNTNQWAKISQVYKLNPMVAADRAWMKHVENVSKKTKVPVSRVFLTLEQNSLKESQIWALNNKLKNIDRQIKGWEVKAKNKGKEGRFARSQINSLRGQKSQIGRVVSVLSEIMKGDEKIVKQQIEKMRKTRGSLNTMKKMDN